MAASAQSRAAEGSRGATRRISQARRELGLTQKQLADRLGVSLWTVDRLEKGSRPPSVSLSQIADAVGRPLAWFIEERGSNGAHASAALNPTEVTLSARDRSARNAVLGVVALIVLVRFFTEVIGILPAAGNFIDIPLLILLSLMVVVRPADEHGSARALYLAAGGLFLGIAGISSVLNPSRVEPGPALVFVYGFLAPIAFFFCVHRLWPPGQARALSRVLIALGLIQFLVIATIDLPRFLADGNPDHISGTFGENPYQLVFFLLVFVSLVAGAATFEAGSSVARLAPILLIATFVVIFLAQYRALLLTTAVSVFVIALLLARARGRGVVVAALGISAFLLGFSYVAERYPTTKFAPTLAAIRERPDIFVRARMEPFHAVFDLYSDRPSAIVTGTGPGTYSSRAWRTFAEAGDPASAEGATQAYVGLLTGREPYRTDVSEQYVRPVLERQEALLGSEVAKAPFSSYSSLLAEVGILGCLILLITYLTGLARTIRLALASATKAAHRDALPGLAIACAVAFVVLLQMAFLDNWLEVARVTIPTWVLLAVVAKECASRGRTHP